MNLLKKLTLVVVGVALPSLFLYMASALWFARYGISQSVADTQLAFSRQAMATLDRALYSRLDQLRLIAGSNRIRGAIGSEVTPAARMTGSMRLAEAQDTTEAWERFRLVAPSGLVEVSTDASQDGTYLPAAEYRTVMEQALAGKLSYSDVFIDPQSRAPTMAIGAPIYAPSSNTINGVLLGTIDWPEILDVLQNTEGTTIELFNREGFELGGSSAATRSAILQKNAKDRTAVQRALRGEAGAEEMDGLLSPGQHVLASYVQQKGHRDFKGNGWVLVIEAPTAAAYAAVNNIIPILVPTFIGLAIAVAGVIIMLLYRAFVRPVKEVTAATKRIAAGDIASRVTVRGSDEIGQLGTSFNLMTDRLQELYDELESKVKEKTAQLDMRIQESEFARERGEAILSGIGEGLIALNDKYEVVLVNLRAAELFGVVREQFLGRPLAVTLKALRDIQDRPLAAAARPERHAMAIKGVASGDYLFYRQPDNHPIAVSITATPILQDDQVAGLVLVVRDITKEREVDRMKTEFISLASHQLRTPLSAIKWFSHILLKGDAGELNDEQAEFTKNIAGSADRMIELVNALLNISRIESGRIIIDPKPTDLRLLVADVVQELQPKIDERQQRLVVRIGRLPAVNLDAHLMSQVYQNVLTNAIKYTPEKGKIAIVISQKNGSIVTRITDNGLGIPAGQQAQIFDKFFRADNVAKHDPDGSGLGLYLARAIIESSGGSIWFKSKEGKGTTFWFSLPAGGMVPKAGEVVLDE